MNNFYEISPKEAGNAVSLIGDGWMLVTAGNLKDGYNTMTASWGAISSTWLPWIPATAATA